ncbi:MAG: 50S ribosomal protein L6 [Anaerolineae bacterium]|nr:50S ribosomal protein L6 [Anaerolineae bacterium]
MSRIGRKPITVPEGVSVQVRGTTVTVQGPKGKLERVFHPDMEIARVDDSTVVVRRPSDAPRHRALHGLTRALIANMIEGVSQGYRRELVIEGVGYRADMQDQNLVLSVGYSHPVVITPPPGISFEVARGNRNVYVDGIDKELVGEVAAKVRAVRPPEPYKGKGIAYAGERIRRKAGKAGKAGAK